MKIILSRKGFDSKYGSMASPIMPDGTLLSFPIPSKEDKIKYSDLLYKDKTYLEIIRELKPLSKLKDNYKCHLDPDIRKEVMGRENTWRPLFGQADSAQVHLLNKGIKEGDLFLFFGTFKESELFDGKYRFKKNAIEQHIIFGYLQVGKIYNDIKSLPKDFNYHPHTEKKFLIKKNNCIYRAAEQLSILDYLKGAGCFQYDNQLILTKKGFSKSKWDLPDFFKKIEISRHSEKSFKEDYFQSVALGQEIVIEENVYVTNWAKNIIKKGMKS